MSESESRSDTASQLGAVSTSPLYSEPFWLSAALVTAVLVGGTVIVAAILSLFALNPEKLNANVDVIYKLGLIGVGVVTFCTVVWRGLISARQADTQREQILRLSEQIATTDENNRAKLLLEGAEMLADSQPEMVAAGIVALKTVAMSDRDTFAVEAMDLLVEYVADKGRAAHTSPNVKRAIAALTIVASATERNAEAEANFASDARENSWVPVRGASQTVYEGGLFVTADISTDTFGSSIKVYFFDVEFVSCNIASGQKFRFKGCTFRDCKISKIWDMEIENNYFDSCDFSSCTILGELEIEPIKDGGNYYFVGRPPEIPDQDDVDPASILQARENDVLF